MSSLLTDVFRRVYSGLLIRASSAFKTDRFLEHCRQTGMYGPPICRKRKVMSRVGLRKCIKTAKEISAALACGSNPSVYREKNFGWEAWTRTRIARSRDGLSARKSFT